jgi:low temperature requirement protein LtrA
MRAFRLALGWQALYVNDGLVFIVVVLVAICVPAWGFVYAAQRPRQDWDRIGRRKAAWIGLQIVFFWIGSVIYLSMVRPQLHAAVH